MKPLLVILSLFALPLHAEIRGAIGLGGLAGPQRFVVGTLALEARGGNWSVAPTFDLIRGGHDLHAIHVDARRYFPFGHNAVWIGAGPTFVSSNAAASKTTWNAGLGYERRTSSGWDPFLAARYYPFELQIFRDEITLDGPVVSIGVSRRF
jgi:hypothetical protein